MPGNIPVALELDVSALTIGDQLRLADMPLPEGVSTQVEPETVVVQVAAPRVVAEVEEGEEGEAAEGAEGEAGEGGGAEAAAEASDDTGDE